MDGWMDGWMNRGQGLPRVRETFELNQLKSTASQLLPVFQDLTGCKLVAVHLDRPISYAFFQVPANILFIVMTSGEELGHR
jgi:hypothetical protein